MMMSFGIATASEDGGINTLSLLLMTMAIIVPIVCYAFSLAPFYRGFFAVVG